MSGWVRQDPKTGRWTVRYRSPEPDPETGRRRQLGLGRSFATKREAKAALAAVVTDISRAEWREPELGEVTLKTLIGEWLAAKRHEGVTSGTMLHYERSSKLLLPPFGDMPVMKLTPPMVRRWWTTERERGTGPTTLARANRLLAAVLDQAVVDWRIKVSPMPPTGRPREPRWPEPRFLTLAEAHVLADCIRPEYRTWLWTMLWTGMRWAEGAGLKAGRVNLLLRRIEVAEQLVDVNGTLETRRPKTDAGKRLVDLPDVLVPMLTEQIAGKKPDEYVFTAPMGGPLRIAGFRKWMWTPATKAAGLYGLRIHDLRHTHVAWLIEAGEQSFEVAKRIGHTKLAFTLQRYGHMRPELGRRTADALDRLAQAEAGDRIARLP